MHGCVRGWAVCAGVDHAKLLVSDTEKFTERTCTATELEFSIEF